MMEGHDARFEVDVDVPGLASRVQGLDEQMDGMTKRVESLEHAMNGNGKLGVKTKVAIMWHVHSLITALVGLVAGMALERVVGG